MLVTEMVMPREILRDQQEDLKVKVEQDKSNNYMRCNRFPHLQRNAHRDKLVPVDALGCD